MIARALFRITLLMVVLVQATGYMHFDIVDTNSDGYIDHAEAEMAFGDEIHHTDFFAVEDRNKDGRVSRKEYFGPKDEIHHTDFFAVEDRNKDGRVSRKEYF